MTRTCADCHRPLRDPASLAAGRGPVCLAKYRARRGLRAASPDQLAFPTTKDTHMEPTATRQFTREQLADLGIPPAGPDESDWTDAVVADEYVSTGKYTQHRRTIFQNEEGEWAVEYEASLGGHQDEAPDDHGWDSDLIEATPVEERLVLVPHWVPVDSNDQDDDEPEADDPDDSDSDSNIFALIAEIASRLRDATDGAEYHGVGLIYDLANGQTTVADAREQLADLTFRHI
ncbi:DUF6011 domain-containing protein [Streptomyces odonnellii]|uniref:DUF6011 domain-containing protein n=1 Tax=Streptomyces odonnellii TaxID=1417980 RepID=UPI0006257A6F|nr:DUF6011 domain-containing protein [Streptomyces odonnellii]